MTWYGVVTILVECDRIYPTLICPMQASSTSNGNVFVKKLFFMLFTQGLCIVLELHQHSAAQKLSREVQQIGVVEEYDEFLEFSGHGGWQIGYVVGPKIECVRCTAVLTVRASKRRWNFGRGNAHSRRRSPGTETRSLVVAAHSTAIAAFTVGRLCHRLWEVPDCSLYYLSTAVRVFQNLTAVLLNGGRYT